MSNVVTITQDSFREVVIGSERPVLVDFWAEWCGPCKKLGPVIDQVAEEMGDRVTVGKVNVDNERTLGAMFQIMSIPAVMIFKNGEKVDEFVGVKSKAEIIAKLERHLG